MISKLRKLEVEDGEMDPANATPNVEEFFTPKRTSLDLDKKATVEGRTPAKDDRQLFAVPSNGWLSGSRRRLIDA